MSKPILSDHDKTLTVNGKAYRVRYYTVDKNAERIALGQDPIH